MQANTAWVTTWPRLKLVLLVLMLAGISALHYGTAPGDDALHLLYREAYLVPLVLAGFWFGLRGGVTAGLATTALYLPYVLCTQWGHPAFELDDAAQLIVFNLVSAGMGYLRERDRRRTERMRRDQGLAVLGQTVSGIAHDMKSPLVTIGGFSNQVLRSLEPDDPRREKLGIVLQQTERLDRLVKDMLDYARPHQTELEPVDVNDFTHKVFDLARSVAAERGLALRLELDERAGSARLDRRLAERALMNLINNALDASPPDGVVTVRSHRSSGWLSLEVLDQGPGMSPVDRQRLLTPFVTTKKEGSGLGLPIVSRAAEAHGGRLVLSDNKGGGARCILELPV